MCLAGADVVVDGAFAYTAMAIVFAGRVELFKLLLVLLSHIFCIIVHVGYIGWFVPDPTCFTHFKKKKKKKSPHTSELTLGTPKVGTMERVSK